MREFLVAGNWKMNGSSADNARLLDGILDGLSACAGVRLLVCPSFPYLSAAAERLDGSPVAVGVARLA